MACSGHLIDPKHTDTAVDCFSKTATIELGGGELTFEPFSVPVPEVIMVHGPQGGWHILGSILTQNIRQIVELDFDIFHLATGSQISDNTYRLAMVMEDECSGYYPGLFGYINFAEHIDGENDTPPELFSDDRMEMVMRINDCSSSLQQSGTCIKSESWVEVRQEVIARPDPIDVE